MIVAETDRTYRFVSQPDHAALAGQFADRWGNDRFAEPAPAAATAFAAHRHDDGWIPYDRRPHLDAGGSPVDFRETPPADWIPIYDRGVDVVAALDAYAGLLVSMHGSGLRRRRYGLSPSWSDTPPAYEDFVDRQERRQTRLARGLYDDRDDDRISSSDLEVLSTLHATGEPPEDAGGRLWRNYRLLQAWDTLSLAFCTTRSPPGYPEVDHVPTAATASDATLSIDPLGDGDFRLDPYPFDVDPLVVTLPTRTVAKDAFDDGASPTRVYYEASLETESFTLGS